MLMYPDLKLDVNENGETIAILKKDYTIKIQKFKLTVPKGFSFDGNSIPRCLWFFFGHPLAGVQIIAAMIHDYLYKTGSIPRSDADFLYYCLLRSVEIGLLKRSLMWLGVRIGGWLHYNKNKNRDLISF